MLHRTIELHFFLFPDERSVMRRYRRFLA